MKIFNKIKQKVSDTYLCIKYPFLYPRNRITGRNHVYFRWLNKWLLSYESKAYTNFRLGYKFYNNPEDRTETNKILQFQEGNNIDYTIIFDSDGILNIYSNKTGECSKYDLQKHVGDKFTITGISLGQNYYNNGWGFNNPVIIYHCHKNEVTETNYGFSWTTVTVCNSKYYARLYKMVEWFWYEIVDRVCIIPRYTELDAMPEGWRKAFGLKMCDEIKHSLLHTYLDKEISKSSFDTLKYYWKGVKQLYGYRIDQIKEKFGCYDKDTEVLTKNGWKFFDDITYEDEIATLDDNDFLIYQKPVDIIKYRYKGKMYNLYNRGVDLLVTPNHNLYVAKGSYYTNEQKISYPYEFCTPEKYYLKDKRFKKGAYWKGDNIGNTFKIPDLIYTNKATSKKGNRYDRTYCINGPEFDIHAFLKFLGFYVAEGYTSYKHGTGSDITLSYNKNKEHELVTNLITSLGFKCSEKNSGCKHFSNAPLAIWLKNECGHKALNKKIPRFIFDLPPKYIEEFLEYLYIGDGYKSNSSNILTTVSKQLCDDVCELLIKAGYTFSYFIREPRENIKKHIIGNYKTYNINWLKNTEVEIDISKIKNIASYKETYIDYDDNVFCVTIPNHKLYIRRNGKGVWCGNSLRWYDSNTTEEVLKIIDHYEDVSRKTCIVCGKPATYMTTGWICPYCDEHIKDKDYATRIENT